MSKTRLVILALTVAVLTLYFKFLFLPVSKGFDYFAEYAATLINKKQRVETIRTILSVDRFVLIQRLSYLFGIAVVMIGFLALWKPGKIHKVLVRLRKSFVAHTRTITQSDRRGRLILAIALLYMVLQSLWYMYHLPFIQDENYTISNFVLAGPLASISFYPYPNNHILFSLFSFPFSFLPMKPEVAFRLPSLIAVAAACVVLYRLLLNYFTALVSGIAVFVFVNMLPVLAYSIFARGYSLLFLWTTLLVFALAKVVQDNSVYHRFLLCVFSIAGLYTLPTFLYPLIVVLAVYFSCGLCTKRKELMLSSVACGLICGACTLVLYLPPIITSGGWQKFVKIIYVGYDITYPLSVTNIYIGAIYGLQFFEKTFLIYLLMAVVIIGSALSGRKMLRGEGSASDKVFFFTCLAGFIIPLLAFLIQRKIVGPRTHSYAALFFVGLLFTSIKLNIKAKWRNGVYVSIAVLMLMLNIAFAHNSKMIKGEWYTGETAESFAKTMVNDPKHDDVLYCFEVYYIAAVQLRYALSKRPVTVYQSQEGSPSSAVFDPSGRYRWIITAAKPEDPAPPEILQRYTPVVQRDDAVLWKRKDD